MSVFDIAFISIVYSSRFTHASLLPNRIIVRGRYGGVLLLTCFIIE